MNPRTAVLAGTVTLALALAGCGGGSSGGGTPSSNNVSAARTAISVGLQAQQGGDLTTAATEYNKALTLDPKNKYALFDLGTVDFRQHNLGLAIAKYQAAIAVDPKFEPALYNLSLVYLEEGNSTGALPLMQRAVASDPSDAAAHWHLALLLRNLPKYQKAANEQMQLALRLDPSLSDPAGIVKSKKGTSSSATPGQTQATSSP